MKIIISTAMLLSLATNTAQAIRPVVSLAEGGETKLRRSLATTCLYSCPNYSFAKPDKLSDVGCVRDFDDCECELGFHKEGGNACVAQVDKCSQSWADTVKGEIVDVKFYLDMATEFFGKKLYQRKPKSIGIWVPFRGMNPWLAKVFKPGHGERCQTDVASGAM